MLIRQLVVMLLGMLGSILFVGSSYAVPIVHTADFIDNGTRSNFNSFENISNNFGSYTGGSGPYIEDGIQVQQINPLANIWVTYNPGGRDGSYAWYPNGGDFGYTSIRLSSGLNFDDVGFLIGSGNGSHNTAYFELWDDGALVLASSVAHQVSFHYLGFEGGGFDTIFLRDGPVGQSVGNGTHNALTVDAIEVSVSSVPEPGTWLLMGTGLVGLLGYGWRRRNA